MSRLEKVNFWSFSYRRGRSLVNRLKYGWPCARPRANPEPTTNQPWANQYRGTPKIETESTTTFKGPRNNTGESTTTFFGLTRNGPNPHFEFKGLSRASEAPTQRFFRRCKRSYMASLNTSVTKSMFGPIFLDFAHVAATCLSRLPEQVFGVP